MKTKICALVIFLFAGNVFAWGPVGHRTIGLIADGQLTPQAQKEVQRLLGNESLADIANWADSLKSTDKYKQTIWYHFEKIEDGTAYLLHLSQLPDWQLHKGGVVMAILSAVDNLRNPQLSPQQKTDSLKFLVHFIGDLHQPLHSGRPADYGGVKINIEWNGEKISLHKLWDSAMISSGHADILQAHAPLEESTARYCDYLLHAHQLTAVNTNFDVEAWLNESLALRTAAYDPLYLGNPALYQQKELPVIDQRIYEAGMRLAAIVNDIYAGTPPSQNTQTLWSQINALVGDIHHVISFNP